MLRLGRQTLLSLHSGSQCVALFLEQLQNVSVYAEHMLQSHVLDVLCCLKLFAEELWAVTFANSIEQARDNQRKASCWSCPAINRKNGEQLCRIIHSDNENARHSDAKAFTQGRA